MTPALLPALAAVSFAAQAGVLAAPPVRVITSTEDADDLAQGFGKDGFIDAEARAGFLAALQVIRSTYPWTREIHSRRAGRLDTLEVWLGPAGEASVRKELRLEGSAAGSGSGPGKAGGLPPGFEERSLRSTGIAKLDELDVRFEAAKVTARPVLARMLRIQFHRPMDLETLGKFYLMLPEVREAGPVKPAGGGNFLVGIREGGKWHVVFSTGARDCLSGCADRSYDYFTYDAGSRKALREHERIREASGFCEFRLWGVPDRPDVCPFLSYRNLVERTRDPAWWIARHAVEALGFLLSDPKRPAYPEDERPPGHFEMLRDAAVHRRDQGLALLVDALAYPDEKVAEAAYGRLKALTREDFGAGPEGRRRWRQWLGRR